MSVVPDLDPESLRRLVIDNCGFDPGILRPDLHLVDIGISGISSLQIVSIIENLYEIDFPADLLTIIETVDDLVYFTIVKAGQREAEEHHR